MTEMALNSLIMLSNLGTRASQAGQPASRDGHVPRTGRKSPSPVARHGVGSGLLVSYSEDVSCSDVRS